MVAPAGPRTKKRPARKLLTSTFPFVIKAEREGRGMGQREWADFLGVSQSLVSRWESGRRQPSLAELTRLGHLLNITWHLS